MTEPPTMTDTLPELPLAPAMTIVPRDPDQPAANSCAFSPVPQPDCSEPAELRVIAVRGYN